MSHAINSHVLMNAKPCVHKTINLLIMTRFATFHVQNSGQYSINTEASASLQLYVSMKDLYARVLHIWILLTHFILETPKGVLAKSGDPDQMPHNVASDLGLHYFASFSAIFQQKYIN